MVLDWLIVMDDVSGLADRSEEFANFLTVSRKFGLTCVYIFHTIYPARQHWQMILSLTKIFNFFQGSVQASSIIRILSSFVTGMGTITHHTETFGLTDCTFKFNPETMPDY